MPARRGRSFYVPPHLRQPSSSSFRATTTAALDREFPSDDRHPRSQLPFNPYRSRPGRGRGDGGRRRQPYGRNAYPDYRNHVPFEEPPEEVITEGSKSEGFINFEAYDDVSVEVSGENIPAPANSFEEIDLGDGLHKNISRCRYEKPTPIQRHAIPIVVAGRDLMACAQTGSGKTAAFCLPIICGLLRNGASNDRRPASRVACPTALVLSPTRELSCQIHEEARKFAYQTGIKIGVAYGGAPLMQQVRNLERGVDVLVATPGRLVDMVEKDRVSLRLIKYLAIDEADRMLDMGFEPQIRRIVEQLDMPLAGARQTLLFSATFPNDIQMLASDFLSNYIFLAVGRVGSSTELIAQKVEFVEDMDKKRHLKDLLHARREAVNSGKQELTLVFVETKRRADFLESWLSRNGFPAVAIHGDKAQVERERVLRSFKSGTTPIMVATDVASRGLDIPNVAHVINFDLPQCIDDYVHRIGRTGRAGKSGLATAFFNSKNFSLAKALADIMKETNQEIPPWLGEYDGQSFDVGNNGMLRNYRSSKFSGRDFRRGSKVEKKNSNTSYSNYSCSTATDHHAPAYADYSNALADQQLGCQLGYESIEPSGWE